MSRFVDEIIDSIKQEPQAWAPRVYVGHIMELRSANISLVSYGNGPMLSILHVETQKAIIKTTWLDRFRLERAISYWFQNATLEMIST